MADFSPPVGPPPPKVPEGWKAQYNQEWKEWFYVNLHTGVSTWDKPAAPAPFSSAAPAEAPSGYIPGSGTLQTEKSPFHSNNPYNNSNKASHSSNDVDADARLAAQLQAEEDARARSVGGGARPTSPTAQQDYERTQIPPSSFVQQELPPREQKRSSGFGGLLSKLTGKHAGGGGHGQQQSGGYPPYGYPQQGYGAQQPGYGGYPPQGSPYGGGYGGGYGAGSGHYGYPPKKSGGAGMGMAGGAALGLGAGLVGGALLADEFDDNGGDGGGDGGGGDGGGGGD